MLPTVEHPRPRGIVGIPRRSLFGPVDEGRAISQAMAAARGCVRPTPVAHGGRIIGYVRGESPFSERVLFHKVPAQYRMAWIHHDNIIASLAGEQKRLSKQWGKVPSTAMVANSWYDLWTVGGNPPGGTLAGVANTANIYDDMSQGALYLGGNKSPDVKSILSAWAVVNTAQATFLVYDRVLDYHANAYTAGVSQAMVNGNVAQRYIGTDQPGLEMMWTVNTAHNNTASDITVLTYVDNAGAPALMPTGTTVSIILNTAAPSATFGSRIIAPATAGQTVWGAFIPKADGTTGARSVTDYTTSAVNTGTFVLALIHPLVWIPLTQATNAPAYMEQVFQVDSLPRLFDGAAVAFMMEVTLTSGFRVTGNIDVGWG